jgi:CBS domain containing-hemolysin-like protein
MPGETLGWKGNRFTVLMMDGPRIERVQILASNGEGT